MRSWLCCLPFPHCNTWREKKGTPVQDWTAWTLRWPRPKGLHPPKGPGTHTPKGGRWPASFLGLASACAAAWVRPQILCAATGPGDSLRLASKQARGDPSTSRPHTPPNRCQPFSRPTPPTPPTLHPTGMSLLLGPRQLVGPATLVRRALSSSSSSSSIPTIHLLQQPPALPDPPAAAAPSTLPVDDAGPPSSSTWTRVIEIPSPFSHGPQHAQEMVKVRRMRGMTACVHKIL